MASFNLEKEESQNRQIAFMVTSVFNAIMLFLFWYVTIWNVEENRKVEQIGGSGFIVNFGTDKTGSGSVYTRNRGSKLKEEIDSKPSVEPEAVKKVIKKPVEAPVVEKAKPTKPKPTPEAPVVTSNRPSPVKVKEQPNTKVEPTKRPPVETKTTPAPAKPVEPQIIEGSTLPSRRGNTSSNGTTGTNSRPGGGSDGTGKGTGNQGQSNGNVVEGGTYERRPPGTGGSGNGGSGGGSSFSLSGWTWNSKPQVDDDSDETGVIRFRIKVDSDGIVQVVELIESTVSPSVAQRYKKSVQRLTFRPTSSGERPDLSVGTITFRINSK